MRPNPGRGEPDSHLWPCPECGSANGLNARACWNCEMVLPRMQPDALPAPIAASLAKRGILERAAERHHQQPAREVAYAAEGPEEDAWSAARHSDRWADVGGGAHGRIDARSQSRWDEPTKTPWADPDPVDMPAVPEAAGEPAGSPTAQAPEASGPRSKTRAEGTRNRSVEAFLALWKRRASPPAQADRKSAEEVGVESRHESPPSQSVPADTRGSASRDEPSAADMRVSADGAHNADPIHQEPPFSPSSSSTAGPAERPAPPIATTTAWASEPLAAQAQSTATPADGSLELQSRGTATEFQEPAKSHDETTATSRDQRLVPHDTSDAPAADDPLSLRSAHSATTFEETPEPLAPSTASWFDESPESPPAHSSEWPGASPVYGPTSAAEWSGGSAETQFTGTAQWPGDGLEPQSTRTAESSGEGPDLQSTSKSPGESPDLQFTRTAESSGDNPEPQPTSTAGWADQTSEPQGLGTTEWPEESTKPQSASTARWLEESFAPQSSGVATQAKKAQEPPSDRAIRSAPSPVPVTARNDAGADLARGRAPLEPFADHPAFARGEHPPIAIHDDEPEATPEPLPFGPADHAPRHGVDADAFGPLPTARQEADPFHDTALSEKFAELAEASARSARRRRRVTLSVAGLMLVALGLVAYPILWSGVRVDLSKDELRNAATLSTNGDAPGAAKTPAQPAPPPVASTTPAARPATPKPQRTPPAAPPTARRTDRTADRVAAAPPAVPAPSPPSADRPARTPPREVVERAEQQQTAPVETAAKGTPAPVATAIDAARVETVVPPAAAVVPAGDAPRTDNSSITCTERILALGLCGPDPSTRKE